MRPASAGVGVRPRHAQIIPPRPPPVPSSWPAAARLRRPRQLSRRRLAVEQVQGLRQRGRGLHFAGAGGGPRGSAEGRQEVVRRGAVRGTAPPDCQAAGRETRSSSRHLRDAVEQHLGPHASDRLPARSFARPSGWSVAPGGELVSPARRCSRSSLISKRYSTAFWASAVEQLRIAGRIADTDVVDRLDDPQAEEMGPDEVGDAAGEYGFSGEASQPGQHHATVRPLDLRGGPPRNFGRTMHRPSGMAISPPPVVDDRFAGVLGPSCSRPG